MPTNRDDLLRTFIPPATAIILTLLYFIVFDRWTKVGDPINSIVAMITGTVGFAIGALIDMQRAARSRKPATATGDGTSGGAPAGSGAG